MAEIEITDLDINVCVAVAAQLGLYFVGTPENEMMLGLHQIRSDLQARLSGEFGAEVAAVVAQAFVAAIVGHRREIEGTGGTPRVLN